MVFKNQKSAIRNQKFCHPIFLTHYKRNEQASLSAQALLDLPAIIQPPSLKRSCYAYPKAHPWKEKGNQIAQPQTRKVR